MSIIVTDCPLKAQTEWLLLQRMRNLHPYDKLLFAKKRKSPFLWYEVDHFQVGGCMTKILLLGSTA